MEKLSDGPPPQTSDPHTSWVDMRAHKEIKKKEEEEEGRRKKKNPKVHRIGLFYTMVYRCTLGDTSLLVPLPPKCQWDSSTAAKGSPRMFTDMLQKLRLDMRKRQRGDKWDTEPRQTQKHKRAAPWASWTLSNTHCLDFCPFLCGLARNTSISSHGS